MTRTRAPLRRPGCGRKCGTGLGLAIVKHVVNRHRGVLDIDSTPGKGSTFTVYLPAAAGGTAETLAGPARVAGKSRKSADTPA